MKDDYERRIHLGWIWKDSSGYIDTGGPTPQEMSRLISIEVHKALDFFLFPEWEEWCKLSEIEEMFISVGEEEECRPVGDGCNTLCMALKYLGIFCSRNNINIDYGEETK